MLRHILTLARASNLPSVWSNCLAATLISGAAPAWLTLLLLTGVSFLYAAGCTLNDAFDAEWDARNRPERLIPSGVLSRRLVWTIGLVEIAGGLLIIFAGNVRYEWPPLALAACILAYDAWHKQSALSVIIMGACRWLLYLIAASGANLTSVMVCGAVIWLYIVVLSLVARGEAKRGASAPPSRYLLPLIPTAILAAAFLTGRNGREIWAPAIIAFAGIGLMLPRSDAPVSDWVNRLLASIPIVDLCLVLTFWDSLRSGLKEWTLCFPAAVALSLLFQRWFKAT